VASSQSFAAQAHTSVGRILQRMVDIRPGEARALAKLRKLFGITKVRIDGGGVVWGSFLKASLIDEISHIVVPVADGSIGTPTVFDAKCAPTTGRTLDGTRLRCGRRQGGSPPPA
jgi:riboflavin biosynthesis pyrimidine reductase